MTPTPKDRGTKIAVLALCLIAGSRPSWALRYAQSHEGRQLIQEGAQLLGNHRYSSAVERFEKAAQMDSSFPDVFFQLGNAYYQRAFQRGSAEKADQEDARRAVESYKAALSLDPRLIAIQDPFLFYHGMAQCYDALGLYAQALDALHKAVEINPHNPMPHLYAAKIEYKIDDRELSTQEFKQGVILARRLRMYPALARLVRNDDIFSPLLDVPQNSALLKAYDKVQKGEMSESEAFDYLRAKSEDVHDSLSQERPHTLRESLEKNSNDADIRGRIEQGDKEFSRHGYRSALDDYQAALAADSNLSGLDAAKRSLTLERMGIAYRHVGMTPEALRALEQAVAVMPQNPTAHYQLALSYCMEGKLGQALTALNKALDTAASMTDLRKMLLTARTDPELEPLTGLTRYREILQYHTTKLSARR